MAYTVEQLEVIVDAKIDKAINGLKKTEKATKSFKDSFIKSAKVIAGPLAAGAIIATTVKMASEFSKAASDAEEIGSKYNTIFRDMRTEADAMAENFANNFGLASSSAKELLGNTADLLTGLGFTQDSAADLSIQVNTLAADLASFSNFEGGTQGASEALTKALLGEAESAKALGIVINQNTQEYKDSVKYYTEVEGKTLLQAKAFTALKMATEQSGNAIGDVARTWESHANVQRRLQESTKSLKEELGKQVNEGLTPLLSLTDKMVRKLTSWISINRKLKEFFDDTGKGSKDATYSLEELHSMLAELEQKQMSMADLDLGYDKQIKAIQNLIDAYGIEDQFLIKAREKKLALARLDKENADAEAGRKAEAMADMDALKNAYASTKQGQIDALKTQIAYFEEFKKGPMAVAVLEDLYSQLEALQGKQEELTETTQVFLGDALVPLSDAEAEMWQNYGEHIADAIEDTQDMEDEVKELNQVYQDLANEGIGAFASAFKDIGSGNKDLWEGFKDAGKDAISAVLEGLAKMALVQAALDLAAFNFAGAAAYTAAAAGAYAASGYVQTLATGGSFTTTGPTPILVGDNTSGQERVTIEPIGGNNLMGDRPIIMYMDGQPFRAWFQNDLDNGTYRIPRRILV